MVCLTCNTSAYNSGGELVPTLFFMPWAKIKASPATVGPITLLQYERDSKPGPLGKTSQATLDAILGNYAERAFAQDQGSTVPVQKALLLRWPGDDNRETLFSAEEMQERFQQAELLVFAAISARLYGSTFEYCNADDLTITAQHFSEENPASTAVQTRRRDGRGNNMMAGMRGKPVFLRPMHTHSNYSLNMEWEFALALLKVPAGPVRERLMVAVTMYIRANSDANEVPETAEVIFMRAALETLVNADHTAKDLKAKLGALMAPRLGPVVWHEADISPLTWQERWTDKKGVLPDRPFSAWMDDFCHWRNEGAHGKGGGKIYDEPVWSLKNHMMFVSWFMSSIVKCFLAAEGFYTLTEEDRDALANTEMFFAYDISEVDKNMHLRWHAVLNHVDCLKLSNWLREATKDWSEEKGNSKAAED